MKQLPNLLKQESSSAATLINVLLRMYRDPRDAHRATRSGVLERLVPYVPCIHIRCVDADTQTRGRGDQRLHCVRPGNSAEKCYCLDTSCYRCFEGFNRI